MTPQQALDRAILLFEYGSKAHGTDNEFSDHDLMAVTVEPPEYVLGLNKFESTNLNTASKGERSTYADTDVTVYGLRKWASLAARGNPTVLTALFAPEYQIATDLATAQILNNADAFISKEAGRRYLGYSKGQRQALIGMRNKRTNRPELIHQFGYDTKFGYHMARTLIQGAELMRTGRIQLPMNFGSIEYLKMVRNGEISKDQLLKDCDWLEGDLEWAIDNADLPEHSDEVRINKILQKVYEVTWTTRDEVQR